MKPLSELVSGLGAPLARAHPKGSSHNVDGAPCREFGLLDQCISGRPRQYGDIESLAILNAFSENAGLAKTEGYFVVAILFEIADEIG